MVGHHASLALNWVRGTLPLTWTKSKKFCVGSWDALACTVAGFSLRTVQHCGADVRRVEGPSSGCQAPGALAGGSLAIISKKSNDSPSSSLDDRSGMTERLGFLGERGDTGDSIQLSSAARGEREIVAS
jgi:hypothetical protein